MTRFISILLALFFASSAFADSNEDRLHALVKRLTPQDQEIFPKAKYAGHYSLWQLVTYSVQDGRLVAAFHLPAAIVKQFADPAPLMISLEASPHLWTLHRSKSGTLDEGLSLITLTCYAPDETWPFNRFALSSDGHRVMVTGAQMFGHPSVQQSLSLAQSDRLLHLGWRLAADRFAAKKMDVTDLAQIPTRIPQMMERYLLPILRRLGPARPASDVYRVFDQIPADPKVVERIMPLVNKLDSDDSAARDAAAAGLKAMGPPALLACLRLDRSLLSPEQTNRVNAFCAADGWVHVPDLEAARNDVDFLTACLEDEDPAVRLVAENLLAAQRTARQLKQ